MNRLFALGLALFALACTKKPAAPFDTLPDASVTAYRLQNFEPPPPAAASATQPGLIPGIPPEIQQWAQQALPGLQQMIPPGLLPPGLIPGLPAPVPTQVQTPRFHNFRILEAQPVADPELKKSLAKLLGNGKSFEPPKSNCLYAEMGLSFTSTAGAVPNDLLVSFSCNQMQGHNFIWPHASTGMTSDTVQKLSEIVAKLFPPTPVTPPPAAAGTQPVAVGTQPIAMR